MKIGIIPGDQIPLSPQLPFSTYSIPQVAYRVTEGLVKCGHQVTVFGPADSKTSAQVAPGWLKSTSSKFKQYKVYSKERNQLFQQYCQYVVQYLKKNKFDIIHNHTHGFFPYIKQIKVPVVTTFHNPSTSKNEKTNFTDIMMVGISKKQMENNKKLNFVGLVYHGIWPENYPFSAEHKDYLLWLSRIFWIKGPLQAAKIAVKSQHKMKIVGTTSNAKMYRDYNKKLFTYLEKHKQYFRRYGLITGKQKIKLYQGAKAYIFPILWDEPFGLVMIEAMSCGTPVIAFNHGSTPEVIKHGQTGFIVKNINEAVIAVKNLDQINRADCRRHVEKYFTVDKMTQGYEKIFTKIIKQKKK